MGSIHFISGPTRSGKSTYLGRVAGRFGRVGRVVFPFGGDLAGVASDERVALHYNILRPYGADPTREGWPAGRGSRTPPDVFRGDPAIQHVLAAPHDVTATVLVVAQGELRRRVWASDTCEPLRGDGGIPYPSAEWARLYDDVDVVGVYEAWIAFLERARIGYELVDSS